jgi:PHD/YefM family antitoxin component YafN of YafNO toxin-antitoxin module
MKTTEVQALVKYVTNADGQTTDVLVPLSVWEALLENNTLEDPSPEEIADSLHRSLDDVKAGRTKPLAELWASLDAE